MRIGTKRLQFFWSFFTFIGIIGSILGIILLFQEASMSFLGLQAFDYFVVASYCLPLGITFAIPLASHDTKDLIWTYRYVWILLGTIGILGSIYSLYLAIEYSTAEFPNNVFWFNEEVYVGWGSLAIVFLLIAILGQTLLLASLSGIQSKIKRMVSKLGYVWLGLGVIALIVSFLGYIVFTNSVELLSNLDLGWEFWLILGATLSVIAIPFLIMSDKSGAKYLTKKISFLWVIGFLVSLGILGICVFEYLTYEFPEFLYQLPRLSYYEKLAVTGVVPLFISLGLLLPHLSEERQELIARLQVVWVLLLLIASMLVVIGGAISANLVGGNEFENTWNIFGTYIVGIDAYMFGIVLLVIACAFISRVLYTEAGGIDITSMEARMKNIEDRISKVGEMDSTEISNDEKMTLIVVKKESAKFTYGLLKSAYRRNEISEPTYLHWAKNMAAKVLEYDEQIKELEDKSRLVDQTSLFAEVVSEGEPTKAPEKTKRAPKPAKVEKPAPEKTTPAPPSVSTKPSKPPTPSEVPPAPTPVEKEPKSTSPPAPTPVEKQPSPAPPKPSEPTPSSAQGTDDAVESARSTSIAELRGEMLKELQRLKDIFDEDEE